MMGSTGDFHLTFDPPASDEQLADVREALTALDWDAPAGDVLSHGTQKGRHGDVTSAGEEFAYWRKPLSDAHDGTIVAIMEAAGLNGHGFLIEHYGRDQWKPPEDRDRFAFGRCPEMRARIEHSTKVWELWGDVCTAWGDVKKAAESGDDAALVDAAGRWREARKVYDDKEGAPDAT